MTSDHDLFHTPTITGDLLARCDAVAIIAASAPTGDLVLIRTLENGQPLLAYPQARRAHPRSRLRATAGHLLRSLGYTCPQLDLVDIAPPPTGATLQRPIAVFAATVRPTERLRPDVRALTVTRTEVSCMDLRPPLVTDLFVRAGATPADVVRELTDRRHHDASFIGANR